MTNDDFAVPREKVRSIIMFALLEQEARDESDGDAQAWQGVALTQITEAFNIDLPKMVDDFLTGRTD